MFSDRVQPHSPGLAERLWYGGASLRSAQWAGEHGMNFLTSSVVKAEESRGLRRDPAVPYPHLPGPPPRGAAARVSQGLVVIPTDRPPPSSAPSTRLRAGADAADRDPAGPGADDVRARPGRHAPTRSPSGCTRTPAFREIDEVAFALPFSFEHDDYVQILTDIATALGRRSAGARRLTTPQGPTASSQS